jgi:hypothetical protein
MGISRRAYARYRGVSDMAVRKAIKSGRIVAESDGSIDPNKADTDWERNSRPTSKEVASDYYASRAERESYLAAMAKLDLEEREGKLLDAEEVGKEAFSLARRVRDRLMLIPHRLGARMAMEADAMTAEQIIETELRKALEELQ